MQSERIQLCVVVTVCTVLVDVVAQSTRPKLSPLRSQGKPTRVVEAAETHPAAEPNHVVKLISGTLRSITLIVIMNASAEKVTNEVFGVRPER